MREIKFRYVFKKPNGHIVFYFTDIQHLEHADIDEFLSLNFLSIERDLISRDLYIGLNDKNVKEIYEGDIVNGYSEYRHDFPQPIFWSNKYVGYYIGWANSGLDVILTAPIAVRDLEVIGNIYENPELLRG